MMRRVSLIGFALVALLAAASFVDAAGKPDAWLTTKAKIALMTTEGVSGSTINVDTVDGRITLHGKVATEAEKTKAADVARKIEGVKEVRNLLQVVPEKREKAVEASDSQIKDRVSKALENDRSLADSSISVQSVNQGVVLLAGTAKTMSDHLRALDHAAHVPGVRRVASEVKAPEGFAADELQPTDRVAADTPKHDDRPAAEKHHGEKSDGGYGMGDAATDMWITSATKLRLMADGDTPAHEINVDTRDGVVTLFGMVPSEQAKRAAEADARKVSGVKNVVNELQVVARAKEEAVKRDDAEIERAVEQAIEKREDLKDANIKVEVTNGIVRLSGTVPNETDRLSAAMAARSTSGVRSVLQEDLRTK